MKTLSPSAKAHRNAALAHIQAAQAWSNAASIVIVGDPPIRLVLRASQEAQAISTQAQALYWGESAQAALDKFVLGEAMGVDGLSFYAYLDQARRHLDSARCHYNTMEQL